MPVALGDAYATPDELRRRQGIPDGNTYVEADLEDALLTASRAVDEWCGRTFGRAEVVSVRAFPVHPRGVDTDDFWTTDGLAVGGTAWTPATTGYVLEPVNGVVNGLPGWPYSSLSTAGSGRGIIWPELTVLGPARVEVAARWGWAEVPSAVKSATLMLAAEELKLKDTTFGVAGFGDYAIRVRSNPKVAERLAPYRKHPLLVGS